MIEKIDPNNIQNFAEKPLPMQPNTAGHIPDSDKDASAHVENACLIEKAMEEPQTDINAVQRAKELLLSGGLEAPKNIREAAENIIKLGI